MRNHANRVSAMRDPSPCPAPATDSTRPGERTLIAAAIIVGVLIVAASMVRYDGDIAGLIRFGAGETVAEQTAHVEDVLGRDVATVANLGHDGRFFFLQALDPFYLSPDEHAVHLDRPLYRAQRMLFPTLAGLGGLLPPGAVLWTMTLTNIAALALGTVAAGRLAVRLGGTHWLGLAFPLNPGVIFEFDLSGGGVVAFAAALWGTLALEDGHHRRAIAWFTAAVLARELMLIYLAGICVYRLWRTRRIPWLLGSIPALSAAAWASYVRLRLDSHDGVNEVQEFGPPFGGILDSFENWLADPTKLSVITGLIIVMPLLILRAWQRPNALVFGALGFVPLAIMLTQQVWLRFTDISRAVIPIMTAYVITAFSAGTPNTESGNELPHTSDDATAPS
jgi:hypothetical protein